MNDYLKQLPGPLLKIIREIGQVSDDLNLVAFLVGGIVRDCILERSNFDVDIVVEGKARVLAKALAGRWNCRIVLHKQFQTATLFYKNFLIDISSARNETYDKPGALPIVQPGTVAEDLFRRDFTINALAVCLNKRHNGQLLDPLGGFSDLIKGKIRIMHDHSFLDDPTRILRAVRFQKRYKFSLSDRTRQCLKLAIRSNCERTVTSQRLFVEFKKIMKEADPLPALKMLNRTRFLRFIKPQATFNYHLVRSVQHFYDSNPRLSVLFEDEDFRWLSYFLAFISFFDADARNALVRRFHFTKHEKKSIIDALYKERSGKILSSRNIKKSRIFKELKKFNVPTLIFFRCAMPSQDRKEGIQWYLDKGRYFQLSLTGEDLKEMGVSPGHRMGEILSNVLDHKIDYNLKSRKAELLVAKKFIGSIESP
ncbi:MAG: hypothetical protein K8S27_02100 [Candidatus Omnitrophica bacterium]|nr:hypothetical protein [Candidatus Omnitrophota bacterium]